MAAVDVRDRAHGMVRIAEPAAPLLGCHVGTSHRHVQDSRHAAAKYLLLQLHAELY